MPLSIALTFGGLTVLFIQNVFIYTVPPICIILGKIHTIGKSIYMKLTICLLL